jgi:hypothetical protein
LKLTKQSPPTPSAPESSQSSRAVKINIGISPT